MTARTTHPSPNHTISKRGQGALEYLLLIGGAVLIATIVLLVIVGSSQTTNTIIGNNLSTSDTKLQSAFNTTIAGLGGGTSAICGNNAIEGGESCDGTASFSATCYTQGYSVGTLGCSGSCQFDTSTACSGPGPFTLTSIVNGATGTNNVTLNFNISGNSGSVGVLPGYVVTYLKDNIGGTPGQCLIASQTVSSNPASMIAGISTIVNSTPTVATGIAGFNNTNTNPPNSPDTMNIDLGAVFAAYSLGIPGGDYCFLISGSDTLQGTLGNYGVPVVTGLVAFPMP